MMKRDISLVLSVVAVLVTLVEVTAAEPAPRKLTGNRPQRVELYDDGRVVLFPETAEFFGEEIRINPDNFCIAWWSQPSDYVAWEIKLAEPGEYEVWLEWAIADGQAGNAFVLSLGEQKLTGKIGKSGGFTSLVRASLGTMKLPAGQSRLEFRASGELRGELADVRSVTLNPVGLPPPPAAPDFPPQSPAASLTSIRVHPAMQVELVAAEPLVRDPIAIAWGPDLKLWVVEMGDYPLGKDGQGSKAGRIKFLEDIDGDGRYDKATLFLDGLGFPTGVLPYKQGVLVTCAPDIFYAEDTTGDGSADVQKTLFTGFPERNQQHRVNGLRWGLDNWIHCANGDGGVGGETLIKGIKTGEQVQLGSRDFRFRPETGEIELQSGPSQFGRNQDDWGNWFGSNNGQPLYHFALDEHYLARNKRLAPPDPRVHLFGVAGPFFTRAPAIAFHGQQQTTAAVERAVGMGGACSGMIYRDSLLGPEFAGNAFVCDPVTNLVHRRKLISDGVSFQSSRADDEAAQEFFASTDPWTRPTMAQAGPDGALYVVDMYRLYIEHPQWIHPSVLARADLRAGFDRGRIYRVFPRSERPRKMVALDRLKTAKLVEALDSPSPWQRDTAQQLLIQQADQAAIPLLAKLFRRSERAQTRLQALATAAGLDDLSKDLLLGALRDPHPAVQRLAVRLAEPRLDREPKIGSAVLALAEATDAPVVMQVAYSLGAWNDPQAGTALGKLIAAHRDEPYLVAAALSSATAQPAALLTAFLGNVPSPLDAALLARVVVSCAAPEDKAFAAAIEELITVPPQGEATASQLVLAASLLGAEGVGDDFRQQFLANAKPLAQRARLMAGDAAAEESLRTAALRMLAQDAQLLAADLELLAEQVSPVVPLAVAEAGIDRLAQLSDPRAGDKLVALLVDLSPALRRRALSAVLTRKDWSLSLLKKAQDDRRLAVSIDAQQRQQLLTHGSPEVRKAAEGVFDAVPSADRARLVAQYETALKNAGDADHGRVVFKAHCAACHRLEKVGVEVGPDLAGLKDKSPQTLLEAVLNPNQAIEDKFVAYNAVTSDGRILSGIVQVESGSSLTLLAADGRPQTILRSELESLASTGNSLMPEGFEKSIDSAAMSDLLSYVAQASAKVVVQNANAPAKNSEDERGTIRLLPRQAALHGKRVGINAEANCIAWMVEGERAEWIIEVAAAGDYEVQIEWSQIDENADNPFAIEAGDKKLTGKFPTTQGWDRYKTNAFGTLSLPAGRLRLSLRPDGPVKSELADVRQIQLVRRSEK